MTGILSLPPQHPCFKDASGQSLATSASRESQTTLTHTQELDISITTVEGDRFTLSADSSISLLSGTYSRLDVSDSSLTGRELETQAVAISNQIAATAVGTFSPEEIRDIIKALRQLLKIERNASHGHMGQAAHQMEKLSKLDSLQSIEASFEVTTQVASQGQLSIEAVATDSAADDAESSPVAGTVSIQA
jgi:hypothetical protein